MKDFIEELRWRGMVHDFMPGIEEQLSKEITTAYIGFDPTAPSLHIGNLAAIMLLKHLQLAGHKPVILVGGATGMIGDPSGKSSERNLLDEPTIRYNEQSIKEQLKNFLDFNCEGNAAEIVNNYDWFREFKFLDFLRDVGKHMSVNYMMAKDSVKNRLESGISFTEFSYQILQGYDFYHLYKTKGVKLQMGGSDQWGNITTGTELIRRMEGGEAYALTTPLVTKADGNKFGKSEEGNVWLAPEFTSPYKFYQFWLNVADEDCSKLIRYFTLYSKEEIEDLEARHQEAPHQRIMQNAMAEDITRRVHSDKDLQTAKAASSILFGKSTTEELQTLDESTLLAVFEGVPQVAIDKNTLATQEDIAGFLSEDTEGKIFQSKGEAKRMIKGGGVSINKTKISQDNAPGNFELLQGKYLLVQKGKKQYYLVKAH